MGVEVGGGEGLELGRPDGLKVGSDVTGEALGPRLGSIVVGEEDGGFVGFFDGLELGRPDGLMVGSGVESSNWKS